MIAITVDDERPMLNALTDIVKASPDVEQVYDFSSCSATLEWMSENSADVAFVDINMPDKTGLELAVELKDICGGINIIFVTGYSQYAVDAFALNASGYILKPAQTESVLNALANLRNPIRTKTTKLFVQCFGNFEVFNQNGDIVCFERKKSKVNNI